MCHRENKVIPQPFLILSATSDSTLNTQIQKIHESSKIYLLLPPAGKNSRWEDQQNFRQPCGTDQPGWKKAMTKKDVLVWACETPPLYASVECLFTTARSHIALRKTGTFHDWLDMKPFFSLHWYRKRNNFCGHQKAADNFLKTFWHIWGPIFLSIGCLTLININGGHAHHVENKLDSSLLPSDKIKCSFHMLKLAPILLFSLEIENISH